ncbi:MAG: PLP-dependent cysteine synthase family protein [Myxococcales bacterium]
MIVDALAQAVGNTPMVRLRSLERETPGVEIWAKLDWLNPGGSVKDRAGLFIVQDAIERGLLGPGRARTLIDSTSGNTGIAYAWLGAALGVRVALVMPGNVSDARKQLTRAYGAEQIFSDPLEQSDGAIRLCRKLVAEAPERWFYADQYSNPMNPRAHEVTTAEEIWRDTKGRVTHFVAGIGTGGTIMGTARGLRRHSGAVQVIAVEPAEALHGLEGLKHMPSSIVPPIYREEELDRKLSISTDAGWDMAERLVSDEGLLAGHSAGAAAVGALQVARELAASGRPGVVVTLFPDRADRYLPPPDTP